MWSNEKGKLGGGVQLGGHHTFLGFLPGTPPSSHSEDPREAPSVALAERGEKIWCEIDRSLLPKRALSSSGRSGQSARWEPSPTWEKGLLPSSASSSLPSHKGAGGPSTGSGIQDTH